MCKFIIISLGFFDIDALIFGNFDDFDDIKWKLLLWSIGLNPQLRFDLQKIAREYIPTNLALMFLLKVLNLIINSNRTIGGLILISLYIFWHADR